MIPSLPNEILASVLSHLEPTRPSDWHYSGPLAALVRCCLVSKLFLDLARPLLYSTHYLDFDPEYSVQATSRTLSCDLALALRPHLAAHVEAVVVDVDADHDDGLDPNIVPLAVAHALRLSPACARLDLSLRIEVVEQSDFLAPLVQVVIFARPLLRSFIYSASITIPAAIEAADDDHKPQFKLKSLKLGDDVSSTPSSTIPFLTANSSNSLRHLRLSVNNTRAGVYDLARLTTLRSLTFSLYGTGHDGEIALLGTLNAPALRTVAVGFVRSRSSSPADDHPINSDILERIPLAVTNIFIDIPLDLAYLSSFLAANARKIRWRKLKLAGKETEQYLFRELGVLYGIKITF